VISLTRYRTLLARRDLRSLAIASIIGRLPIGVAGLAIMLMTQAASGSFAQSGVATAGYVAGLAILAPLLGRYIDRNGPRRVLIASGMVYPSAMLALAASTLMAAPYWMILLTGLAAGASFPPITVCMRTLLKRLLTDEEHIQTAFSLESVLIEAIFIVGPLIVALLVALIAPLAAVVFAALCAVIGTMLFLRAPVLREWRIEPRSHASLIGPLATPGFASLLLIVLCYSAAFGLVEIAVTGFAGERGQPALAGVMLGLMSVGSVTGALAYGSRTWRWPLARQFAAALALLGASATLLAFVEHALGFSVACVLAGVAMSPPLIIQSMLVAKTARTEHSTEAFTWASTSLLSGVSIGLASGGALLEASGVASTFGAAAAAAFAAALLARLHRRHEPEPHSG
jgi:MFS family permease